MENDLDLLQSPKLIICAPPRTGSEYLCDLISRARIGDPKEYLNPSLFPFADLPMNASIEAVRLHLSSLAKKAREQNLVFSMKLQGWQLRLFLLNTTGNSLFRDACVVYLTSSNIRRQVESQTAAKLTGQWYADRIEPVDIPDDQIRSAYREALRFIISEHQTFLRYFAIQNIVPEFILSEDLFRAPREVLEKISALLGQSPDSALTEKVAEIGSRYKGQEILRMRISRIADQMDAAT